MRKLFWINIGLSVAFLSSVCHATSAILPFEPRARLSFEARAVAGLDGPTRELIATMPEAIRIQILELIKQAKPLIDDSIAKATEGVETALRNTIDEARCQAEGLRETTKDSVDSFLSSLNPFGSTDQPKTFEKLEEEWNTMRAGITYDRKARQIAIATADYLHDLSLVQCKTKIGFQPAIEGLTTQMSNRGGTSGLLWVSLANLCGTADNCLVLRHEQVGKIIETSDKRDVDEANAAALYATIAKPELLRWYYRYQFSIDDYEPDLLKLQNIERALALATFRRNERARSQLDKIVGLVNAAQKKVKDAKNARLHLNLGNVVRVLEMQKTTKASVLKTAKLVRTACDTAIKESEVVQAEVEAQRVRMAKIEKQAKALN
ncbi:hypothetical protein [Mesorhizobium sp. M0146]|uniref:hypothetical protein n=1 Tax=unclassified Mesorhizobium TaxID=325217 RepID=UPI00333C5EA7